MLCLKKGTYFIKVVGSDTLGGDYRLNVKQNIHCEISKYNAKQKMGKTIKLKLIGAKSGVKWKSSNKNIATVNSKGEVKIKGVGKVKISAVYGNNTYVAKFEGISDFQKSVWAEDQYCYEITKVTGNQANVIIEVDREKYKLSFKISSDGKSAKQTFTCKHGKKHSITLKYNSRLDSLSISEATKCNSKLAYKNIQLPRVYI